MTDSHPHRDPAPLAPGSHDLPRRFWGSWTDGSGPGRGDSVLVALSGGLDSLTLLHLIRFSPGVGELRLLAAHFDHRMRSESGEDAEWVRGLCRAWGIPLSLGRAQVPPNSEESARKLRYRFLQEVQEEEGARWLLTGHHADDQAETILFRALRGTGLQGLRGIPRKRDPGVFRPLLSFTRFELSQYALEKGIRHREDPSNQDTGTPRNFLRRVAIPGLEKSVAPGARANLIRLARLAGENEDAWGALIPTLIEGISTPEEGGVSIVRSALLAYHPSVQSRLIREMVLRQGVTLDEAGTRAVLEFTRTGASGRAISLPVGLQFRRDFDRLFLGRVEASSKGSALRIPSSETGEGTTSVGGRGVRVVWGPSLGNKSGEKINLWAEGLSFPLWLRGWVPGDRISLAYGSKKLKKLFGEAEVPVGDRDRVPVLVDSTGKVLWVVGLVVSKDAEASGEGPPFYIGIDYGIHC